MDKFYQTAKTKVTLFKLDFCCWIAPVRVGLMFTGYLNILMDLICLIGIANDGFSPTIMRVQEILIEDNVSKPVPMLAYATELGFSVLLLCAIYRKDKILMRVFMNYTIMGVMMSFLIYSIVIAAVPVQIQLAIIFSTLFQVYIILLVRSVIVEMEMDNQKYELPTLVMRPLIHDKVTPGGPDPKNGQAHEVKIIEIPKKQEVTVTVVPNQDDTIKDLSKDKKQEVNTNKESTKNAEVAIEVEPKTKIETNNKDEKKKEEKKTKDEIKKEEKKAKEDKKKEEKKKKEAEKAAKNKDHKVSNKDVKETWLQTVNEHPKE